MKLQGRPNGRPRVISLDHDRGHDTKGVRELLGSKGANLSAMRQLGLPVPPGFIVTTLECQRYLRAGWDATLESEINAALDELERDTARTLGATHDALLVSVRSGAPVSMPGMMDTVLNVGMNSTTQLALAREANDPEFAIDCFLRFLRTYVQAVLKKSPSEVDRHLASLRTADTDSASPQEVAAELNVPGSARAQIHQSVRAVFESWTSESARLFRRREAIPDDMGTAVVIQAMVYGNIDDHSGSGVMFTRDPATGENRLYGDYRVRAQGEDVVAGTHRVGDLEVLNAQLPDVYNELAQIGQRLERHHRDLCDIEFTVSSGSLYILQSRVGRRSRQAEVRIAIEMAEDEDFPLSKAEAVERVSATALAAVTRPSTVVEDATVAAMGLAASPGVGVGQLCTDPTRAEDLIAAGASVILARDYTSPGDVAAMVGAAGLVTAQGGLASHGAVVARSWGLPAVTSVGELKLGTRGISLGREQVQEGAVLTFDGTLGRIYIGDQSGERGEPSRYARILLSWIGQQQERTRPQNEPSPEPSEHPLGTIWPNGTTDDLSSLEVLRVVGLKGTATAESLSAALLCDVDTVKQALNAAMPFLQLTPGIRLNTVGRAELHRLLGLEALSIDSDEFERIYGSFAPLDQRFKVAVTEWQLSPKTKADLSTLVGVLVDLRKNLDAILEASYVQVPRLARFEERFGIALEAIGAGDTTMIASPINDSFHTIWFELHEELLHCCGRNRTDEELNR